MWTLPDDAGDKYISQLTLNRWWLVLFTIQGTSMGYVLVRTYKHTQFAYLYTTAGLFFVCTIFGLLSAILSDWNLSCTQFYAENEKCPGNGKPSEAWTANVEFFTCIS